MESILHIIKTRYKKTFFNKMFVFVKYKLGNPVFSFRQDGFFKYVQK